MTKPEVAQWLGTTVERMDAEHDDMHRLLTDLLYVPSYSLRDAAGKTLTPHQRTLAELEEHAVLAVSRWLYHMKQRS